MTYDKLEKLMKSIKTLEVYTESRIHLLHSEDFTALKNEDKIKEINRAKQEIFELFQAK